MPTNPPTPPDDDPGPIWEHLPVENFGAPPLNPAAGARPTRAMLADLPGFHPHFAGMIDTTRGRFLLALAIQLMVAWVAFELSHGRRANSVGADAASIVSNVLMAIADAFLLIMLLASEQPANPGAWKRALATGALIGAAFAIVGTPNMIIDAGWVRLLVAPVVLILSITIQIRWGLAPLVAYHEGLTGRAALKEASRKMRDHGLAALLVLILLDAASFAVALSMFLLWGADAFRETGPPLTVVVALAAAVTQTLWLTWLASLFRRVSLQPE